MEAPAVPEPPMTPDVPEAPTLSTATKASMLTAGIGAVSVAAEFSEALADAKDSVPPRTVSSPGPSSAMTWDSAKMKKWALPTNAFSGIGGAVAKIGSSGLKLDIFRDTFQIIGVAFGAVSFPPIFSSTFGFLSSLVSLDLVSLVGLSEDQFFAAITGLGLLALVLFWWRMTKSRSATSRAQDGLEVETWEDKGFLSVKGTRLIVFALTTLYLPISKKALQIVVCHPEAALFCTPELGQFQYLAIAALLLVTALFPYQLYVVIKRELLALDVKPFDAEGNPREVTEELYQEVLEASASPYASLFKGFSRSWATYKVIAMLLKLALAAPLVLLHSNLTAGAAATVAVLGLWVLVTSKASPFADPWDDKMDLSGRWVAFLTTLIGFLLLIVASISSILDYALVGVNTINLLLMVAIPVVSSNRYLAYKKKRDCRLDFTMASKSTPKVFSSSLDLAREKKVLVWQNFWDSLFSSEDAFKAKDGHKLAFAETPDTPPYLKNFAGSVSERHAENKRIVQAIGAKAMATALAPVPAEIEAAKANVVTSLVGVDVYHSSPSAGPTGFGKLYVSPFPFTTVVAYDSGSKHVVLTPAELPALLAENEDSDVVRRRDVRQQLRTLDGKTVTYPYELVDEVDIQFQQRDSEGDMVTRTRSEKVKFSFTGGQVQLIRASDTAWTSPSTGTKMSTAAGFTVQLTLQNGVGYDKSGKKHVKEDHTLFHADLKIPDDYQMTEPLHKLLHSFHDKSATEAARKAASERHQAALDAWNEQCKTDPSLKSKGAPKQEAIAPVMTLHPDTEEAVARIQAWNAEYREFWRSQYEAHATTMTYHFYAHMYNRLAVSRELVEKWMLTQEANPVLQGLPRSHSEALDALYAKLGHLDAHPGNLFWFVYWNDVWNNNGEDVTEIKDHPELFDPTEASSLAYTPLSRKDLSDKLSSADPNLSKYFNTEQLDRLFGAMDKLN